MHLRQPSVLADWEDNVRAQDLALARSHPSYGQRLTDKVFADLCEHGFAIVPEYLPTAQRAEMSAALRKLLPPLVRQPIRSLSSAYHLPANVRSCSCMVG